jgi:hypothetical protein
MFANELEIYVKERLELLREQIKANMEQEGENASGRTSRSIVVESDEGITRLVGGGEGCAPLATLESGYKGAVSFGRLFQWSKDKGIEFDSDKERRKFTFLLQRKIARDGTRRYNKHVDVYTTPVAQAVDEIVARCGDIIIEQIKSTL